MFVLAVHVPLVLHPVTALMIYLAAAGLGTLILRRRSSATDAPSAPRLLLLGQLATLPLVLLVIAAMPNDENSRYPDYDSPLALLVYLLLIASCALGGAALAAAASIEREQPRSTTGFVIVSVAVAAWVMALATYLGGTSS